MLLRAPKPNRIQVGEKKNEIKTTSSSLQLRFFFAKILFLSRFAMRTDFFLSSLRNMVLKLTVCTNKKENIISLSLNKQESLVLAAFVY